MSDKTSAVASGGIGLGCALAVTISFALNKSAWWAILHGIFSWGYVIYYGLFLDQPV